MTREKAIVYEDCISRQAAIKALCTSHGILYPIRTIEALPSVTPYPKTGHWIPVAYDGYADGYPVIDEWECSECGFEHNGDSDTLTSFCPDCGSKMVEPQESEE